MEQQIDDNAQPASILLSDIPLAKAYPNRALTCEETYLSISIRHRIQERLQNVTPGYDYFQPLIFTFNAKDIAREKNIKNLSSFKANIVKSIDTFQSNIPSETIHYVDKHGKQNKLVIPMISAINFNENGDITVKANPDYQVYMFEHILNRPELQIDKKLLLNARCKYTYPLINWLIAMIAEQRKQGVFEKKYTIIAPFEEVKNKVPPASNKISNGNYLIRVIGSAVSDINENVFSNIHILNDDFVHTRKQFKIVDLIFEVEISSSNVIPFVSHPEVDAIDKNLVPSWEYLEKRLKMLQVNDSYIKKVKRYDKSYTWQVLLYTLVRGGDARYFNTVFENYKPGDDTIKSLARALKLARPELCDDIIDAVIERERRITFTDDEGYKVSPDFRPEDTDIYKKYLARKKLKQLS